MVGQSGGEAKANATHWSFRPIRRPELPKTRSASWIHNPIDRLILAKLESRKISPAPEADRRTLIRRLSLDLLGLPPTPAEIQAFLDDARPDAYEVLVDRLLASPHFGERWGRHWLDLARYADSDGYEKDSPRPSPGAIATGSSTRSTTTCRSINLQSNNWPATCFPKRRSNRRSPPGFIATR